MRYIKTFESVKKEEDIIAAAHRGSVSGVEMALKRGADINTIGKYGNSQGRTPLMIAALNKFPIVVYYLISEGANVNMFDNDGRTALTMASTQKIINALLDAGADVNIKDFIAGKNVAMHFFKYEHDSNKYIGLLEKFISKGLDLNAVDKNGYNLYDIIKNNENNDPSNKYTLEVRKYFDYNYPEFKESWELKNNMSRYNL